MLIPKYNGGNTPLLPYIMHSDIAIALVDVLSCFSSKQLISTFTNSNSMAGINLTEEDLDLPLGPGY